MYYSTLDGAISSTDENITISGANGLPTVDGGYYLKLASGTDEEVVLVIARDGYNLFVSRGECGSTAQSWADETPIRDVPQDFLVAGSGLTFTYDPISDSTLIDSTASGGSPLDAGNHADIDVSAATTTADLTLSAEAFQKIYIRMSLNAF
jgi:hypothetical protein